MTPASLATLLPGCPCHSLFHCQPQSISCTRLQGQNASNSLLSVRCVPAREDARSSLGAPHQAVQLGDGALAARLADVPDLHTALATCVDVPCGVADGHSAHHLPVAERVNLPGMPGDARACQGVVGKGYRLHLPVGAHVEGVCAGMEKYSQGHRLALDSPFHPHNPSSCPAPRPPLYPTVSLCVVTNKGSNLDSSSHIAALAQAQDMGPICASDTLPPPPSSPNMPTPKAAGLQRLIPVARASMTLPNICCQWYLEVGLLGGGWR